MVSFGSRRSLLSWVTLRRQVGESTFYKSDIVSAVQFKLTQF